MNTERLIQDQTRHTRLSQVIEAVLFVGVIASVMFFSTLGVISALLTFSHLLD